MGWFWADKNVGKQGAKCPVDHNSFKKQEASESACPIKHSPLVSECPIKDNDEVLNPLNNMPMAISSEKATDHKFLIYRENYFFYPSRRTG